MSELETIRTALQKAGFRHRLKRALRGLWAGLLIGAILSLLVTGVYHIFPIPLRSLILATACPFLGALVGFIVGGWKKTGASEVARWVDREERLKERLSTALELSNDSDNNQWRDLIIADAADHAKRIDAKRLLPFGLPKTCRWALVVLAVAAGLGFAPEYRSKSVLQKQADQANIKETGRLLADLTRRQLERRPPAFEPTQKSMEAVSSLGDELTKKTLTRSDALKDLASVTDKLKDQLKEMGKEPGLKRLEEAARKTGGNDSQSASALQKQIDSLQKQLGTPTGTPNDLDKLQKNLEKLQQAARGLADKNSSDADAERQKLSESLSELSKQIQGMGLQLPQLDDAINALAANQTDLFLKDLEAATTDLEKMKEMAKSLQQMQQQMEKLGKDLAEQLKNGQPEIAHQTLQKMITQLNSANLTPEQLQKMLDEVSRAVDPAGNYGKVAEHLKAATGKMKGSDKSGAAQSLAAAAKELEDLMQQMGDAQELSATLDALNQASMCIGSGKCWGMCKGPPRVGPGGKPGRGVGTWADENAEWDGESTTGWDNSGLKRPDMEGRGQTDRGDGELNDALKPTKVKGQFTPGGPMPSITLKGVSIKGQSKVDYEEAATAAQSDAQSALSQEKVPRAYQGAVKDYFDDLKK
jgi:predicted  nucleic acid-binding Zn-ribbon protein